MNLEKKVNNFNYELNRLLQLKKDYIKMIESHISYNVCLDSCDVIVIDIMNYITKFFNCGYKNHSDIDSVNRRIKYFCKYCTNLNLKIHIFINSYKTSDSIEKWKSRICKNINTYNGGIPYNCPIIFKELFEKYIDSQNIHFCINNNTDDEIATWVERYMNSSNKIAAILSGNRSFFAYKWTKNPLILKGFGISNKRQNNEKINFYRHEDDKRFSVKFKYFKKFLDRPNTICNYKLSDNLKLKGCRYLGVNTTIFKFINTNKLLEKVRKAYYYHIFGENGEVKEIKPVYDNTYDNIIFVTENIISDRRYYNLLKYDPNELMKIIYSDKIKCRIKNYIKKNKSTKYKNDTRHILSNIHFSIYSFILYLYSDINNKRYLDVLNEFYYKNKSNDNTIYKSSDVNRKNIPTTISCELVF